MHYSAYLSLWTKIGENNIFNFSVTKKNVDNHQRLEYCQQRLNLGFLYISFRFFMSQAFSLVP